MNAEQILEKHRVFQDEKERRAKEAMSAAIDYVLENLI